MENPVDNAWIGCGRLLRSKLKILGFVLLVILAVELMWAARSDGLTIDEVVYIGSGYAHLALGDYRLNPEQPPLAKLVGALGLLRLKAPASVDAGEWSYGYAFVNQNSIPAASVIERARAGGVILTLLLAVLVWVFSARRYGEGAGLVALTLVAFHPSLLAHGHLVTTDLPGALTLFAGSWAYWSFTRRPSLARAAWVGLLLGIAAASRITGWLLVPSIMALEVLRFRNGEKRLALALSLLFLAPLAIWASYGFHYAPAAESSGSTADPGFLDPLERLHLLPQAYLSGIEHVAQHNASGHSAYLLGQVSTSGWPYYYLVAFLVKNTPGFLLGTLGVLWALWRGRRSLFEPSVELHLLLPAVLMGALASLGRIQIGERYLLPIYPYLVVLMSSLVPGLLKSRFGVTLLALGLTGHVVPCLLQVPRGYIPYFNFLAGGTDGAYRVLVDSNLDWGQDLPRLARWMREEGVTKVQLGYHGSDNPDRFGIRHEDLPGLHLFSDHPPVQRFEGTVVVSPNLLVGLFHPEDEDTYASLRARPPDARAGVFLVYKNP